MRITCDNPRCKYDLISNALGLKVRLRTAVLTQAVRIYCPLCGAQLQDPIAVESLGLCRRDTSALDPTPRYARWTDIQLAPSLFEFEGAEPLTVADICFEEVPLFAGVTEKDQARQQVPELPVRPEFLDLLDMERYRSEPDKYRGSANEARGRFVARLPLKGRQDDPEVERPLVNGRWETTLRANDEAIADTAIAVWPKVRSRQWKTFLVDVELPTSPLNDPQVHVRLDGGAQATGAEETTQPSAGLYQLRQLDFDGWVEKPTLRSRFAAAFTGPRPSLISVGWSRPNGLRCGGTFVAAEPRTLVPATDDILEAGVDFGTSNSCVAFKWHGQEAPTGIPTIGDTYEHLLRPRPSTTRTPSGQAHPRFTRVPYGKSKELLPSELLFRRALGADPNEIDRLCPGLDYGIPGDDVDWGATNPFGNRHKTNLKWGSGPQNDALLSAFLRGLVVQTLAAHLASAEVGTHARTPSKLLVRFSFPGVWGHDRMSVLKQAFKGAMNAERSNTSGVRWAVSDWFGGEVELDEEPVTEALAVARLPRSASGPDEVAYKPQVIVDVGGGTTDIALLWVPAGRGRATIIEYMTSMEYAGNALFAGLGGEPTKPGSNCFADKSLGTSERRLRSEGPTKNLFSPEKEPARSARIKVYLNQLLELVARLSAAPILSGSASRRNPQWADSGRPLPIEILRLGNGLGLSVLNFANLDEAIRFQIQRRVDLLVGVGKASIRVHALQGELKHAVGIGLLHQSSRLDEAHYLGGTDRHTDDLGVPGKPPWTYRGIVGVTCETRRDGGRAQIEWWREISNMNGEGVFVPTPWGMGEVPLNPSMPPRFTHDDSIPLEPAFPDEVVSQDRAGFDRLFLTGLPQLESCVANDGWFKKSPLEKLLETKLKDRLKTVNQ